ncbi:MAG: hypothetical protein AAF957_10290 [Planctomycetota bacterium]
MLVTTLALVSLAQGPGPAQVVLTNGMVIPGPSQDFEVLGWGAASSGVGGGWIAEAAVRGVSTGEQVSAIVGEHPGPNPQGPSVLYREGDFGGSTVDRLSRPSMANGRVAFLGRVDTGQAVRHDAVVIDGLVEFVEGDVIPGSTATWFAFSGVHVTPGGVIVQSGARQGTFWNGREILFDSATSATLFASDDVPTGLAFQLERFHGVRVSPDGSHWVAIGQFRPPHGSLRSCILVDGEVLRFGPSALFASQNRPVPPAVEALLGPTTWQSFWAVDVNDEGTVAFQASRFSAGQDWNLIIRDGLPVSPPDREQRLAGIDGRGVVASVLGESPFDDAYVERESLQDRAAGIDVDGDGIADAGYGYAGAPPAPLRPSADARTLVRTVITTPMGAAWALLRVRDHRIDRESCTALPNSTGRPARMVMSGSRDVVENDVVLQALQLPQFATGYFLVSDTPDYVVAPGGSQGALCLGGSIGRMLGQVFASGTGGQGRAVLDLDAIPRPTGTVPAAVGQTWFAQAWYRDAVGGTATSNFTGAVTVTLE